MSTRFTEQGTPMVESHTLQLIQGAGQITDQITEYISRQLKTRGYSAITPTILNFLSSLECGTNYGSQIARSLGISRQMVAKMVKQLCEMGYLEQIEDVGRQKKILFTLAGERLMSESRKLLAELDQSMIQKLGATIVPDTIENLVLLETHIRELNKPTGKK